MIEVGQRVSFVPHWDKSEKDDAKTRRSKIVTGVVTMVNAKHRMFWYEYGHCGTKQVEAFNFHDIGDSVRRA